MLLSAGDNGCLNRSGDILRYLKNCSRSSFNSLNKVLNTPETERLRKISCDQKHCFCFSFVCFCFFNFKSRKHKIVYFKNSSSVHNCIETEATLLLNLLYLTSRRTLIIFPIETYLAKSP